MRTNRSFLKGFGRVNLAPFSKTPKIGSASDMRDFLHDSLLSV